MQSHNQNKSVVIIGGGPAGLMAAEVIASAGYSVSLYDAMPSVGRKFLLAGIGGMNITHAEEHKKLLNRYNHATTYLTPYLNDFCAEKLRDWVHGLGIETFVGSSNRVFPSDMKAAPLLRAWLHRLRVLGIKIHPRHKFIGWDLDNNLCIQVMNSQHELVEEKKICASAVVFALGGASWPRLGSDGAWVDVLKNRDIAVKELEPSNCGFIVNWGEKFRNNYAGAQLSTIRLSVRGIGSNSATDGEKNIESVGESVRGEAVISAYGIEGTSIYALSRVLREQIKKTGAAELYIDLLPDITLEKVVALLNRPRGKNSQTNFLRKQFNLPPVKLALINDILSKEHFEDKDKLAHAIKALPVKLIGLRPIDEAISCAGGVQFSELDESLMIKKIPGVFCAGEMLDWEAPTGGYLLTACFATGYAAGKGVIDYLHGNGINEYAN